MGDKEAFVRQRRNLIVMSFLIIVLNLGGAQLTSLSLLGNELNLSSPDGIAKALAAVLLYFLLRYFQYLHVLDDTGVEAIFKRAARNAFKPKLLTLAFKSQFDQIHSGLGDKGVLNGHKVGISHIYKDDIYAKPYECVIDLVDGEDKRSTQVHVRHSWLNLVWPTVSASVWISVRTPTFTEYVLPPLFACMALSTFFDPPLSWIRVLI